jgi:hypothetical protein
VHAPTPSARGAEPLRPFPSVCLPSRCARRLKFDTISGPTESRRTAACSPRNTQRSARALARVCVCVCVLSVCVCVCVCRAHSSLSWVLHPDGLQMPLEHTTRALVPDEGN